MLYEKAFFLILFSNNKYCQFLGWKASVEQQISGLYLTKSKVPVDNTATVLEGIRSTALSIYEQYLGEKSEQKVQIKPSLSQAIYFKIRNLNETPSDLWFDNILDVLYERMANEYLPSFKKSKAYIKLLQELDLLQQGIPEDDTISLNSNDSTDNTDNLSATHSPKMDFLQANSSPKNVKHVRSLSDVTVLGKQEKEVKLPYANQEKRLLEKNNELLCESGDENLKTGNFSLTVNIIETGKYRIYFLVDCLGGSKRPFHPLRTDVYDLFYITLISGF